MSYCSIGGIETFVFCKAALIIFPLLYLGNVQVNLSFKCSLICSELSLPLQTQCKQLVLQNEKAAAARAA